MEAKDLRIGNWILNGINEEFQANGETINNFNVGKSLLGAFKPIELTEQWLIDFGFKVLEKCVYAISLTSNNFLILNMHHSICIIGDEHDDTYDQEIAFPEFTHKLQNLYHSLTGKELTK